MPTKRYPLEAGGAPRVELTWKWNFKDVVVKVDGLEVGRIADAGELKQGRDFALTDGSSLRVQLIAKFHAKELVVLRNGEPLPGSSNHPMTIVKTAAGVLGIIAAINIVWGVIQYSTAADAAIGMVIEGLIYAFLAWRVSRRGIISLVIAILLYAADTIFTLMQGTGALHGIIIRVIVFLALGRAFGAIRELKSQTSVLPPVPA